MEILYVDDDPDDIELFEEALRKVDPSIKFSYASSARDALACLRDYKAKPDAIFIDFHLPGRDGHECVMEIKADGELKKIPVVLLSTSITTKQVDQFNKLGVYYFLSKSALLADLEPALKIIIDSLCKGERHHG
jgi:CheY-like chemotaxis protein